MSHLTPEILRAAALRLWDGHDWSACDWDFPACVATVVYQVLGDKSAAARICDELDIHNADTFFHEELFGRVAARRTACQAARFDFLNLLACSLEG